MKQTPVSSNTTMLWIAFLICYLQVCNCVPVGIAQNFANPFLGNYQQGLSDIDIPGHWQNSQSSSATKRAWQNLQAGWGKRLSPNALQNLQNLVLRSSIADSMADYGDYSLDQDIFDWGNEKRSWKSLNGGGWGKRSDWGNFRGSWGKRDPAWTNLKGN
ncbi:allatostatins MIP isoform X2 [Onthophagus taurus]|uniref:allatostatins MIP isoform X2 n=1 Tax=Onthophagus taurus TaxID=166361 RepID=UPI000C200D2C|nr:allatostatins MIP isoform X2 [Onthophagus taurus]